MSLNPPQKLFQGLYQTSPLQTNPNNIHQNHHGYQISQQTVNGQQYYPIPPQNKKLSSNQLAPNRKNNTSSKIKVVSGRDDEDDGLLNLDLFTKAVNNSYMMRLSGNANQFKSKEIVQIITDYGIKNLLQLKTSTNKDGQKLWKQYDDGPFFIVEIDEQGLESSQSSNIFGCGKATSFNNSDLPYDEIVDKLKLYSLVFQIGANQLHFQSLNDPGKAIFLNMDTIALQVSEGLEIRNKSIDRWKYPIIIRTQTKQPVEFVFYITHRTLPFPLSQQPISSNTQYLTEIHDRLLNFLQTSVSQSRGRNYQLKKIERIILSNEFKFFEKRYATEEQFDRYCQTGDILLFRGKHFFGKMQRFITNSFYDHVGIVYRSQQYGLCLFQSNSGTGVAMAIWRQLLRYKWYEGLERVTWRKLKNNIKGKQFQDKVTQFIKMNLHKEFKISLSKLLKFQSKLGDFDGSDKNNYFCSELVATLYKHLGLLEHKKSSTQYWPKDFSDHEGLQILNGALDPEREIVFEDQLIKLRYPYIK